MQTPTEQIQLSLEEAERLIEQREKVLRLAGNKDFQDIITDGYLKGEAVRLTHLLAEPTVDTKAVHKDLYAVAALKRFLSGVIRTGDMAESDVQSCKDELERIRYEDAQDAADEVAYANED